MATHKSFFTKIFSAEKKQRKNRREQIQNEILREENTQQTSSWLGNAQDALPVLHNTHPEWKQQRRT